MQRQVFIYILIITLIVPLFSCRHSRRREPSTTGVEKVETGRKLNSIHKKSIIKMYEKYGVYHIPCKINGTEMEFIFDTGASDITMSLTEALFLYKQGKLKDDDFIGTQQYQIADGSIHEGAIVRLQTVQIGNRTLYNIQASIVDNLAAPLLLGQSALSEFGKVSVDYNRNEITFE
ncbi:MAG: retroviral-like aspartic protease family protein [Tannerella sp.]|jgi:aspartyl protease family protein|nr:retroviral-like aspartic protease family protein [Tannerella sp.]